MGAGHNHGPGGHAHGSHAHGSPGPEGAGRAGNRKRLAVVLAFSAAYMVAEVVGGLATNSLALLADAGHMLSDVASLALALFALWFAQRPPTPTRTYGYYRAEILAALVNGATLVAAAVFVLVEAWERFRDPPAVQGGLVMAVAAGGLVVNLVGLWVLNAGRGESLNVRGAWLHVATDALGSVGAILGGALVYFFGLRWADPAVSVLIGVLVAYSSWNLLREAVAVLMEGAPGHVDVDQVRDVMAAAPGVTGVHDLHVWSITSNLVALSGHVRVRDDQLVPVTTDGTTPYGARYAALLTHLRTELHGRFGIDHVTIQVEPEGHAEPATHP